jgi:hypothetical protein
MDFSLEIRKRNRKGKGKGEEKPAQPGLPFLPSSLLSRPFFPPRPNLPLPSSSILPAWATPSLSPSAPPLSLSPSDNQGRLSALLLSPFFFLTVPDSLLCFPLRRPGRSVAARGPAPPHLWPADRTLTSLAYAPF